MDKEHHVIKLDKCVVVLTKDEINTMLLRDTEIFKKGLQRGKAVLRYKQQKDREKEKYEREGGI